MINEITISDPEMSGPLGGYLRSDRQSEDKVRRDAQPVQTRTEGGCISPEILEDRTQYAAIGDAGDRYPFHTIVLSAVTSLLFESNPSFDPD
jgi:hypothetical protein